MADLRIVDAPEIPTENITGEEKLPTGGSGNYSISLDSLADYTKTKKDLVDNITVDNKVNGVRQELDAHIEDLLNPHQVTKSQIGLGNVDNTADADKPVSNSAQAAIISAVAPKADKTYVDNQIALKANKADVYTKSETYTKQESSDLVNNSISTSLTPVNVSLDLAKRGVANHYDPSLTYNSGERVVLTNGDIVKSTIDGNTNDPNVDMTGWRKPNDLTGSPIMFGAKGNGVFDDTLAIQKCANKFRYLDMRNGNWKTTGKIALRSGTVVDLRGSYLSANNTNEPIFEFENAGDGLSILGGGGYVYGTADSFLKCSGKTYQPTKQTDYARRIRLDGLHVVGENIDKFLDFDKAVRQVFLTHVFAYTKNGMFCNGKCVEFEIYGSIIYGAMGANDLTTYGIKYRSPGNGRWYNEGLHITDSTIDNFGTTFDITDIYAMNVTGGHIGAAIQANGHNASGALVAKFGQPTSTACRNIKFANVNIYGNIEFAPVSGIDYQAKFTGCSSEAAEGANIFIKNNASSITVSNHTFHSSTNNGVAVVCQSNNFNISVNDITCDSTFVGGVHVNGATGDNVSVRGISYAGTGDPIYCDRPILISGVPVATANMANRKRKLVNAPPSTYVVSQTIAAVSAGFAKGETGEIVVELSYSGATPTNQILNINVPDGLVVPSGTGWSSQFVLLKSESGTISARIPYFVTQNISAGDIALVNFAGSALSVDYHSYFGLERDW